MRVLQAEQLQRDKARTLIWHRPVVTGRLAAMHRPLDRARRPTAHPASPLQKDIFQHLMIKVLQDSHLLLPHPLSLPLINNTRPEDCPVLDRLLLRRIPPTCHRLLDSLRPTATFPGRVIANRISRQPVEVPVAILREPARSGQTRDTVLRQRTMVRLLRYF